jgi:hypothetical protein
MSFGGGSGGSSISGSTDVVLNNPANNNVLGYNSGLSKWQNQDLNSTYLSAVVMVGAGIDPTGVADSTAAIQAKLNVLPAAGGLVSFPPGTYKISAALVPKGPLVIQGAGDKCTIISQTNTTADGIAGVDLSLLTITGVFLQGPTTGTGIGIHLTKSVNPCIPYVHVQDVTVYHFGGNGIDVANSIVSTYSRVQAVNCGGAGFYFHGDSGVTGTSTSLTSCYANTNTGSGFKMSLMSYCSLNGCASEGNLIDYELINCQGFGLYGCGSEVNRGTSLKISGGIGVNVSGFWSYQNSGKAIWVTGSAVGISLMGMQENSPTGTATACVQVDAGSGLTMSGVQNVTANVLAAGSTVILNDNAGRATFAAMTVNGPVVFAAGTVMAFGGDTNLYRVGVNSLATDSAMTVGGALHTYGNLQVDGWAGFYGHTPAPKPTVSGAKSSNAALSSLIAALVSQGLITDTSTA